MTELIKRKYYFTETQNTQCYLTSQHFTEIEALNDDDARRIAWKNSMFQGTTIQLFYNKNESSRFAWKYGKGKWQFDNKETSY